MKKTLKEIREEFEQAPESEWEGFLSRYRDDERSGVQKLLAGIRKKQE